MRRYRAPGAGRGAQEGQGIGGRREPRATKRLEEKRMRHIIRAVVMVLGAGFGCATAPVIIEPGPGHPASTMEPEAPRPAATLTLKAESIPSVLDHAPKGGAASRE